MKVEYVKEKYKTQLNVHDVQTKMMLDRIQQIKDTPTLDIKVYSGRCERYITFNIELRSAESCKRTDFNTYDLNSPVYMLPLGA